MNMISQTHLRWVQAMAVIVAVTPYLSGCNSGSASTAQQDSPATTVAAAAASTSGTVNNAPPSAAPASTNNTTSASTSRRYSLVSSSGQTVDASAINQSSSLSFGSTGAGSRPELEGADLTPLSDTEIAAIETTSTPAARIIQESVLGFDDRYQVNTGTFPERAVSLITYNGNSHCTGWLVSRDTLVTAGHCVYGVYGGNTTSKWRDPTSFKIYPGYSDGQTPYGSCTAKELYSSSGWTMYGDNDADMGVIKLNCSVGNSTGYFSYFAATSVDNAFIGINGYPGDKNNGKQQWASTGTVTRSTPTKIYYANDTTGGMSGSPVWVKNNDTAWAIGIHTNGDSSANPTSNSGTRISQDVFELITAVKDLK